MNRMLVVLIVAAAASAGAWAATANGGSDDHAEIAALKQRVAALERSTYHPELGEQMLGLQIRHARLWYAGQARNWILAAFEVQEIKEALDAVVEQNPDAAPLQPQRLADVLPAMTRGPIRALRDAADHRNKAEFERAFDALSAACTGCHRVAGNTFLVIQRPRTPLLDNLRAAPEPEAAK